MKKQILAGFTAALTLTGLTATASAEEVTYTKSNKPEYVIVTRESSPIREVLYSRTTGADIYRTTTPPVIYVVPLPAPRNPSTDPNSDKTENRIKAEIIRGDVSGDGLITEVDADLIIQAITNGEVIDPATGDFDKDGTVTALDAAAILKYLK